MSSRGARGFISPRTKKGFALSWSILFILSLLIQYATFATAPSVLAVHDEGLFELDGNAVNNASVAGDDWNQVFGGTSSAEATKFVTDPVDDQTDPTFTGGSTKDDHDITDWLWKHAKPQAKNDITHAFAAAYTAKTGSSAGDTIVYFGLNKFEADGDNFVGFWFLKSTVGPTGPGVAPGSHFSGAHIPGDILVLADYTNGGSLATFKVYRWVVSGGNAGTHLLTVASGVPCTASGDDACGSTNENTETAPWPYDGRDGAPGVFPPGTFFEGGINLTNLGLDTGCFTTFIAETRSSQSVDATLSDFASGTFSFCQPPKIVTQVEQDGQSLGSLGSISVGDTVNDTATLTGSKGTVTGTIEFFVCSAASSTPDCSSGGTKVGDTKTFSAGKATSDDYTPNAGGTYCFRVEYTPPAEGSKYLAASHTNATTECFKVLGARIAVTKTAVPAGPVSAGDEIGFDVTVTNAGDGTATGVVMTDDLPAGVDWTAGAPTGDTGGVDCAIAGAVGSQTLTCTDASMAAGDSFTVHISGDTDAADCGTISNTAHVGTTNDGEANATATVVVNCPDIAVVKTAESGAIKVGDTAEFHITVSNVGAGDATGVVVTDELPGGLDWQVDHAGCSITDGTLTCNIGDLAAGASVTIDVTADTDTSALDSQDCHVLDNTASAVASNEPEDALGNNSDSASIDVTCTSALVIAKSFTGNTGGTDPDLHVPAAKVGDTLHYSLKYTGAGPLTGAVIVDHLPQGLAYVDGTALGNADFNNGVYDGTARTITWTAKGTLPDPASGTVTYDVKVLSAAPDLPQPLVNTATIDSDQTPLDSDTASVAVLAPPLELTPPPTSTITAETGAGNPGFTLMLILLVIGGLALGVGLLTPAPERVRRRNRLG